MSDKIGKYQRAKIYKIVNDLNDHEYVGSTIKPGLAMLFTHCDVCNCDIQKVGFSKHCKTQKHISKASEAA